MSRQVTDGTRKRSLTVATSRSWRGLGGSAAPGLPGQAQAYSKSNRMSIGVKKVSPGSEPEETLDSAFSALQHPGFFFSLRDGFCKDL